jgi:ABC-type transport system involved in multi-copper enzyme maturation permease subunit
MAGKPKGIAEIARLTLHEASRRWVMWVALILGLLFLGIYAIGFFEINKDISRQAASGNPMLASQIHNFMLLAGMYVVNFLTVLMAVLSSVDTLAGEIASGTIHTLISKPIRRWEVLLGKWTGFTLMMLMYLMLMAGGVILVVYLISGYTPPNAWAGLALLVLNAILLINTSLLGGSFLSTLSNGVMVFGLYGVAFIGGWIEQIGAFLDNPVAVNVGIITSLIFPSDALWRRMAAEMQSPLVSALGVSPFGSVSVPSPLMVIYAVVYSLVVLGIALRLFHRRDL